MEKIIMYGAGVEGEKWYAENHSKYDILYVIDRKNNRKFHGIQVYSKEEKLSEFKKYRIVITAYFDQYMEIAEELKKLGFEEFEDFIWMGVLTNKKLMILYGNCHMGIIADYLKSNPNIIKDYIVGGYFVTTRANVGDEWFKRFDIFITQDIREDNKVGAMGYKKILKKLRPDCRTCIVPNSFGCNLFYPQFNGNLINGNYRDKFIDEIYANGKDVEEIVERMNDEYLFDKLTILIDFKENLNKLRKREEKCDIKIIDFIENNYKDVQLFYEPNHPTNVLLIEVSKRILKYLNVKDYDNIHLTSNLGRYEIFIYESVRKILNLKYKQKFVKNDPINWGYTVNNRPQSKVDYVQYYILKNLK